MKNSIIIIEDDIELCEELKQILEDEGFSIITANNGLDGLNLIKNNRFDLVLLDLKMPEINGLEILKSVKKNYKQLKVIIMTARMKIDIEENKEKNDNEEIILKLADKVIQKPFSIIDLIKSINYFLA